MSVSLSTHVLDTEGGRPAEGVPVRLYRNDELVAEAVTDGEGRRGDPGGAPPAGGFLRRPPRPGASSPRRAERGRADRGARRAPPDRGAPPHRTLRTRAGRRGRSDAPASPRAPEQGLRGAVRLPLRRLREPTALGRDHPRPARAARARPRGGARGCLRRARGNRSRPMAQPVAHSYGKAAVSIHRVEGDRLFSCEVW